MMENNGQLQNRKVSILLGIGIFFIPLIFAWFTLRRGYSKNAKIVSFAWLIFITVLSLNGFGQNTAKDRTPNNNAVSAVSAPIEAPAAPEPVVPELEKVTARQIFEAYQNNEVAADRMYKGQMLEVTGTISGIDSDFSDDAVVKLATSNQFMDVMAKGDDDFNNAAAQLSKGQKVKLQCVGGGEIAGSALLKKCKIS